MKGNESSHPASSSVTRKSLLLIKACALALTLAACSGGDSLTSDAGVDPTPPAAVVCDGSCTTADSFLTVQDVQKIMAQAIAEAQARGVNATIAVSDRVGNILGVYRMGAPETRQLTITSQTKNPDGTPFVNAGLENVSLPSKALPVVLNLDQLAAISKAVTAAYLSSEGNAFSTRSASQIVQDHFNPGENFQVSGPLYGVQFSQLACSDLSQRFNGVAPSVGPQRSPLGLSADPGGLPLYKAGALVGGVAVEADGLYTFDAAIFDKDKGSAILDETIAWAASFGFVAPSAIQGDVITIDGKQFRFSDARDGDLLSNPANAPAFTSIAPAVGSLIAVNGYSNAVIQQGLAFGTPASGIRPATDFPGRNALTLVDTNNVDRFPIRAGTDAAVLNGVAPLTSDEVWNVIDQALGVANGARAGIRIEKPRNQSVRVTISIVDSMGNILGIRRTSDPPTFGIDVSLQKARSVAFMSSPTAADYLASLPQVGYLTATDTAVNANRRVNLGDYVTNYRAFSANPTALTGETAFGDRSIGNLARSMFPDGFDGAPNGPFSKPPGQWSVFSTGLQLDLANNAILHHVLFATGLLGTDPAADVGRGACVGAGLTPDLTPTRAPAGVVRLGNGLQIFAGGVPIYRGDNLVGAIGISGDGIDQDDMVAFLGLERGSAAVNRSIGNAPQRIRADALLTPRTPLASSPMRYVQCPQKPFLVGNEQRVCEGK